MAKLVRIYKNTGFNSSNIPDGQALLNTLPYQDLPAMEIRQERFLSSIRVKVSWEEVKFCDYCRVSDGYDDNTGDHSFYYFVNSVWMEATDVATLELTPDFWTTGNGIKGFGISDGITERVHVRDDSFGKWTGNDPLLTPSEPLKITTHWKAPGNSSVVAIEATLNPGLTASRKHSYTYTDEDDQEQVVSVPKAQPNSRLTKFKIPNGSANDRGTALYAVSSDISLGTYGSGYYTEEADYIAVLRSLGLEQAIVSQTRYPSAYVGFSISGAAGGQIVFNQLTGKQGEWQSGLPYIQHNVRNNLINYSNLLKYGIISCSGEGAEFDPADVMGDGSEPKIRYLADPNPDGKPYFRFKTVNGSSSLSDFWRNCISGMKWKQVPLVFTEASGSTLNTMRYNNNTDLAVMKHVRENQAFTNQYAQSMVSNAIGGVASATKFDIGGTISNAMAMAQAQMNMDLRKEHDIPIYMKERTNELMELNLANSVVVPTVNFPYNSDILRDSYGNGVLVYRYRYSDNDVRRIDKLLTMYGYQVSKPLEADDFVNRRYFNFIKCSNVSLNASPTMSNQGVRRPRWFLDGAAAQLRGGVRIWHVIPNESYYNDNPVA